ncbi:HlyD family type I secretion periplasmic adaptor subunit [Pyruvatibacter mobilis]|uniref:HlyD family type I secretion periplasmic adaptor subunit n=1 Tax=Pyruvatibacter mobilis TaxID=1712261 RepID=UPI003BB1655D
MWEMLKHYWEVAKAALEQEREAPPQPQRTETERAFMPAAIEITETPASPAGRLVAGGIAAFFVLGLIWATFGKLDIHATLQGRIIPTGNVKVIEPLETGTVKAIHVREGMFVEKGALMVELDASDSTVDRERLAKDLLTARIKASRLRATIAAGRKELAADDVVIDFPRDAPADLMELQAEVLYRTVTAHLAAIRSLDGDIAEKTAERDRIEASLVERRKLVDVISERANMYSRLAKNRTGTRANYLEVAQLLYEERSNLMAEEGLRRQAEAAMEALRLKRAERTANFLHEAVEELAEVESQIAQLEQEHLKAVRRDERNRLHAPVAGHVRVLTIHTIGEVVSTGEQLMTVVPRDTGLEVEAMLLNKDKGFVHAEQDVAVKVEAFPFTKYGTVPARVLDVSNDSVQQEEGQGGALVFPVRIALDRSTIRVNGEDQQLTPGMSVTAEVKTGKRRVIEYILTPLLRYRDEAMRER